MHVMKLVIQEFQEYVELALITVAANPAPVIFTISKYANLRMFIN